jgi:hypothetical protein
MINYWLIPSALVFVSICIMIIHDEGFEYAVTLKDVGMILGLSIVWPLGLWFLVLSIIDWFFSR